MSKPLIPFGFLPGHWGLSGQTRELAKIDYEYQNDPYTRDVLRAKILYSDKEYEQKVLELDYQYKKITNYEYQDKKIEMIPDPKEKKKQTALVLFNRGDITQLEYEKELATIDELPWFHLDVDYIDGGLVLDTNWNQYYIQYLRDSGYRGTSDSDVIDEYIRDFGHKLNSDDKELPEIEQGYGFIQRTQTGEDTAEYK